jgi:ribosomal protein S18 acetylase RimI-like enzyme
MALPDIDGLTAMILADDWGDRRTWLRFVATHPACRAAVAVDEDGRAFATAVASVNGPVGWVGTVWVAPERRRDGVGMALTRTVIEQAESAGCRTIVLVATDAGRPLYERIGFEVDTWYLTMEAAGLPVGPVDPRIRPFRADDLDAMAAIDAATTGEDRRHLLEAFATPDSTRLLEATTGHLAGFVVRAPWGGGATIAPDADDAMAILEARRRAAGPERRVRAGILRENTEGAARLAAAGWTEAWRAPRLIRGDPLHWEPTAVWGQFNHALG